MADTSYRGNLSAKAVPFDPLLFGRSVIIKDRDNNYAPNVTSKTDTDKDIGIPQVIYVADALPTEYGYASIGYFGSREDCPGTPYTAFPVKSAAKTATLIHTKEGLLFRLKKSTDSSATPQFVYIGTYSGTVSYANVAGNTYVYFSGLGCYLYDFNTNSLSPVTLLGITTSSALGITATGGYMVVWSEDAIAWSSLVNPLDFVPSLDTGAGGGGVEGAKGAITICVANSYGIYIFTESNCVSAQLSGNTRYPFTFKEIVGSAGVRSYEQVGFEGNQNSAYAFTSSGFQQITLNNAKTIWTDLHEMGVNSPVWNENTVVPKESTPGVDGKVTVAKIVNIASKYICISIKAKNADYYDQIWVYDTVLDKWGRLLKNHTEVFEDEESKIGILTTDKRYLRVDSPFTVSPYPREDGTPYIALGRYQYSRQRFTTLTAIELENLYPDADGNYPEVFVMGTLDGKSGEFVPTYRDESTSVAFASYLKVLSAVNHTVLIKGFFDLNTIVLTFYPGGGS